MSTSEMQFKQTDSNNTILPDTYNDNIGDISIESGYQTSRIWTNLNHILYNQESYINKEIWLKARIQESRYKGNLAFLVLRQKGQTIQLCIDGKNEQLKKTGLKWVASIPLESIIEVYGIIFKTNSPVLFTTIQNVEINGRKIYCISRSALELPFQLKNAMTPDDIENTPEKPIITVGQDVRLDNRILDLRTPANQSIFRLQNFIGMYFREFLYQQNFIEIHTPKLMGGFAEGGSSVFKLKYFEKNACLAQSPQLHKQMAICADFDRVFEIGPVFRAENSNTHRHLCEFTGMDIEMTINEHYYEILDLIDSLFQHIFTKLSTECKPLIDTVHQQYNATSFTWLEKAPRIKFIEAVQMLKDANIQNIPDDLTQFDFSTEMEKKLGALVKEKYNTDFFMVIEYPLGVRPFYTMPAAHNSKWSNSYDMFMRGEEIISGAQRIHTSELLTERAKNCAIDIENVQAYIDSFKLGAPPHGGVGIGLERVLMLFLGLNNIRKSCLFPRDPKRLSP